MSEIVTLEITFTRGKATRLGQQHNLSAELQFPATKMEDRDFLEALLHDLVGSLDKQARMQRSLSARGIDIRGGLDVAELPTYVSPAQAKARKALRRKKSGKRPKLARSALFGAAGGSGAVSA